MEDITFALQEDINQSHSENESEDSEYDEEYIESPLNLNKRTPLQISNDSKKLFVNFETTNKKTSPFPLIKNVQKTEEIDDDQGEKDKVAKDLFDKFKIEKTPKDEIKGATLTFADIELGNASSSSKRFKSMGDCLDFKEQELLRRKKEKNTIEKMVSPLNSLEVVKDDQNLYSDEYYTFLTRVYKEDEHVVNEIRIVRRKQAKVYERKGSENKSGDEADWVQKMIKNTKFKIYFNHYEGNLRFNGGGNESEDDIEDLMMKVIIALKKE